MDRADVVVVGAGPAGATTALRLARAGLDVMLVDRAAFPRAKACGDCISPQANLLLEELGVLSQVRQLAHAELEGWRIFAHEGSHFGESFRDCTTDPRLHTGLAVQRRWLDDALVTAARDAGVRVQEHVQLRELHFKSDRVTGITIRSAASEQRIEARFVVGADGLRSIVRRRLRLNGRAPRLRKVALTAHVPNSARLDSYGEMHLADGRCLGIAPVGDSINLTLVVDALRFGPTLKGKPARAFAQHLEAFPAARDRILAHTLENAELLAAGPFDWPTRGVVRDGAALVGDAAGYYDPFTGQGIFQALHGAKLLAAAVATSLSQRSDQALIAYERQMRRSMRATRAVQQLIEFVCARRALAVSSIRTLQRTPRAARQLLAITGDMAPPTSLLSPAALGSFLTALFAGRRENN